MASTIPSTIPSTPKRTIDGDGSEAPSSSPTPPKKQKTPSTPKTPKTPKGPKEPKESEGHTGSSNRGKSSRGNPIPKNWEEASEADRMIYNMKKDGAKAKDIKAAYEKKLNITVGDSTISCRLLRLMANLERIEPEDLQFLPAALAKYNSEKASRIAHHLQELGVTRKYSAALIQRAIAQLESGQLATTGSSSASLVSKETLVKSEPRVDDEDLDEDGAKEE